MTKPENEKDVALPTGSSKRAFRCVALAGCLLASVFVFVSVYFYYYNELLNGADTRDLNLFAFLVWQNEGFRQFDQPSLSYFQAHISPFLFLINQLSFLLSAKSESFFAGFMAMIHAAFVPLFFYAWSLVGRIGLLFSNQLNHRVLFILLGLVFSIGFAFNGIVVNGLWIGHFEFFIPLVIVALILAVERGGITSIILSFVLAMSLREDVGFHVFSFYSLVVFYKHVFAKVHWHEQKKRIYVTIASFAYSVCAFVVLWSFPDGQRVALEIWSGSPAWAHLSIDRIFEVLQLHLKLNLHWLLPALAITVAALFLKRYLLLAGVLATLPWIIIHLFAFHTYSAHLYSYKAFPLVVVLLWPLLTVIIESRKIDNSKTESCRTENSKAAELPNKRTYLIQSLGLQVLVIVLSLLPMSFDVEAKKTVAKLANMKPVYCAQDRRVFDSFKNALPLIQRMFPMTMVSPGVRRLRPDLFSPEFTVVWYNPDLSSIFASRQTELLLFMGEVTGWQRLVAEAGKVGLTHLYRISGSPIIVMSARKIWRLPGADMKLVALEKRFSADQCLSQKSSSIDSF